MGGLVANTSEQGSLISSVLLADCLCAQLLEGVGNGYYARL